MNVDPRPSKRPTWCSADQSIDAGRVFDVMKCTVKPDFSFRYRSMASGFDRWAWAATEQHRQRRRLHGLQGACKGLCRIHRQAQKPTIPLAPKRWTWSTRWPSRRASARLDRTRASGTPCCYSSRCSHRQVSSGPEADGARWRIRELSPLGATAVSVG